MYCWSWFCFKAHFAIIFIFNLQVSSWKRSREENTENLQQAKDGKWKLKYTVLIMTNLKMYKVSLLFSLFHGLLLWFSFTGCKSILKAFSYRFTCNLCPLSLFPWELVISQSEGPSHSHRDYLRGDHLESSHWPKSWEMPAGNCHPPVLWLPCTAAPQNVPFASAPPLDQPRLTQDGKETSRQKARLASSGTTVQAKHPSMLWDDWNGRDFKKSLVLPLPLKHEAGRAYLLPLGRLMAFPIFFS